MSAGALRQDTTSTSWAPLSVTAWALFALAFLTQVPTWRSLYADGAAAFVEMLRLQDFLISHSERRFSLVADVAKLSPRPIEDTSSA